MSIFYEDQIKEENPDLYSVLKETVALLPDFRPQETVKQMKAEEQNNCKLVYNELMN